jgi:hypothetical protein
MSGESFEEWKNGYYRMMLIDEQERYKRFVKNRRRDQFLWALFALGMVVFILWLEQVI